MFPSLLCPSTAIFPSHPNFLPKRLILPDNCVALAAKSHAPPKNKKYAFYFITSIFPLSKPNTIHFNSSKSLPITNIFNTCNFLSRFSFLFLLLSTFFPLSILILFHFFVFIYRPHFRIMPTTRSGYPPLLTSSSVT